MELSWYSYTEPFLMPISEIGSLFFSSKSSNWSNWSFRNWNLSMLFLISDDFEDSFFGLWTIGETFLSGNRDFLLSWVLGPSVVGLCGIGDCLGGLFCLLSLLSKKLFCFTVFGFDLTGFGLFDFLRRETFSSSYCEKSTTSFLFFPRL